MTQDQFRRLLDKFSRGQCTPEEEQFIVDWYQQLGEDDSTIPDQNEKENVEARIWASINPRPKTAKRVLWPLLLRAAVIAIPLFAFAGLYFSQRSIKSLVKPESGNIVKSDAHQTLYTNEGNKRMKVTLSDGSVVMLEPSSELVVSADFGLRRREVELHGEGFFDVRPDAHKPFLVYANEVVTRVLGTSFYIRAYEDDKEVTVAVRTGKVSVYAHRNKASRQVTHSNEVILTPNQQMVYHRVREVISKTLVDEPAIIVPNPDLFRMQFENAEVTEILDALAQNYGVVIRYDKEVLGNCHLTTSMSDEGLYERIEVICRAIGASYSIGDDAEIIIKSDGC